MARMKKDEPKGGLEEALKKIQKKYGENTMMTFSSDSVVPVERVSTGILPVDMILGGGLPKGRIIEIYGPESSGKTTIALKCIASFQSAGYVAAFIDAEHAFDPSYARALGVNMEELQFTQPDSGEQALDIVDMLVKSDGVGIIVVDSVAALVPQKELDGDFGDANVGLHARLMSQAMRKLTGEASKHGCTIIFINQIREKVGVTWGSPETTTGGRALKFYASVRLDVRKGETIKDGDEATANHTKVKVVKNKTYPPFKTATFDIVFGKGPDEMGAVIDFAVQSDIIGKGGAWYMIEGQNFQGLPKLKAYFESAEGKPQYERIKQQVLDEYLGVKADALNGEPELDEGDFVG